MTLVDSDDTNSTVDYSIGSVSLSYGLAKLEGTVTKYYKGSFDTYESSNWTEDVSQSTSTPEYSKATTIKTAAGSDTIIRYIYS